MRWIISLVYVCLLAVAQAAVEECYEVDEAKGELVPKDCGCGAKPFTPMPRRRHHRKSSSSSSSSSDSCGCVAKPPYPMPPRNPCCNRCSSSSSSSSDCPQHFPTVCPKRKALETVVALDKAFVDLINQGDLDGAKKMLVAGATYTNYDEVKEGPVCATSKGLIADLLSPAVKQASWPVEPLLPIYPDPFGANYFPLTSLENTWMYDYLRCAKYNGKDNSVTTSNVEISYVDRDVLTSARLSARTWVPTYGCNFKLAHWDMSNLVCQPQVKRDELNA